MPSLRLFKPFSQHHHHHDPQRHHDHHIQDDCSCSCHNNDAKSFSAPARWLSKRIRRRSSTSSEQSYVSYEEELTELMQAYEFAEDELAYAIDSQGSVYFDNDRETAEEAIDACVDRFHFLLSRLSKADSIKLETQYAGAIASLHARLNSLPQLSYA
ncbi:hypothetical protein BDB00DRAFT_789177 [Zychaea mexicana]|uniref:uncharacterized protein n=1 Tax=Zychaea mexicana TaxID=64656 RepID=UPI0022FDC93D|nr:uncharacterized protein BDB00DRAFT_789177 [Zychaea mexicana]KAI9491854.1 hypothetical protein BDB00DRAFT_789177 [Zychaea mexicana]